MREKKYICPMCDSHCEITAWITDSDLLDSSKGAHCSNGDEFIRNELLFGDGDDDPAD